MTASSTDLFSLSERYYLPVYRPRRIVLDHGQGARVWDREGREYVDFGAGIAVNALGHAHPALVAALTEQAGKLWHTSNVFVSEPPLRLAEELVAASRFAAARVLLQLRRRGQRGRDQARAQVGDRAGPRARSPRHPQLPRQLPRPHPGRGHRDRAAQVPRGLRAAAAGLPLQRLQRPRRGRSGDGRRRRLRGAGRAGAGRGRRHAGDARNSCWACARCAIAMARC